MILSLRPLLMASLLALYWHPPQPASADNVLAACPDSPNCVSTEATRESQRVPTVPFTDSPSAALSRARAAVLAEPRSTITVDRAGYVRAECRSLIFRFVDDVDIVVDSQAQVFRFRSASRVGRSDLGVNRKRVARIAERLKAARP
jgi:uncharacterized protein (DUF1499 family)